MKAAVNELGKCNIEGKEEKWSGPPAEGAKMPSSVHPPAMGDSRLAAVWRRAGHFSFLFFS